MLARCIVGYNVNLLVGSLQYACVDCTSGLFALDSPASFPAGKTDGIMNLSTDLLPLMPVLQLEVYEEAVREVEKEVDKEVDKEADEEVDEVSKLPAYQPISFL